MKNRLNSIGIVSLLVIGGFVGFVNFQSEKAQGLTYVGGIVYDGLGGPWTLIGSPYIVVDNLTIPPGETLTIQPGVEVRFDGSYNVTVYGTLTAIGTETDRIIITSNKISPAPEDWRCIRATSIGHVEIQYCNVSYSTFGIHLYTSSNNIISNNILSYNNGAINVEDSSNGNIIINNNILHNILGGISVAYSSNNNIITHNNILHNTNTGINVAFSSNNIISYNNLTNNPNGICLVDSSNITITNNNFVNSGIIIHSNNMQVRHYNSHTIPVDNIINGKPVYYYKNKSGITIDGISIGELILANCTDFDVKNLQINNTDVGIEVACSTNISISNNILSPNNLAGIILYSSSNNKIINNKIFKNDWGIDLRESSNNNIVANNNVSLGNYYGIRVAVSSHNNLIANNYIVSYDLSGIALSGCTNDNSSNNTVTGNYISNNGVGIDIGQFWMAIPVNNTIKGNYISNNICGIYIYIDTNNKITGNEFSNNNCSIYLNKSFYNTITNNSFSNGEYGIFFFEWSNNNVIVGNTISNHNYGVYIDFLSSNNRLYHNNFIDNLNQAYDNRSDNYWDDGYPSGGNYWSDFDESSEGAYDDYKGPNQNDPVSGDGIVDNGTIGGGGKNPYVIDSDSQDNYPLINPVDISPPTITNLQPPNASITNDDTPTISANYSDPSGINVSSVVLIVDGLDVTLSATVTANGVSYIPVTALSDGIHTVYLEVKDNVDNLATATWSFTVVTALPPATNLTTKVVNNGNNVELEWDPPSSLALDHYLIYRADSATEFDFTTPHNISTTWPNPKNFTWIDPDPNVTAVDDDFYYIIRAVNFDESDISTTSNTAGIWTRTFESGISTFSLPLEPFMKKDSEFYCQNMNASYIKWMNQTTHIWMRHDKGSSENNTLVEVGEGYEIGFLGKSTQTKYTFTGMPGAMILYDNISFGFDATPLTGDADSLTATVDSMGNVTLNWTRPTNIGSGDRYHVLRSTSRDGFWGTLGVNYTQLAVLPFNVLSYQDIGNATPGTEYYYMIVPVNLSTSERGVSSYSIGVWTASYLDQYDTFALPLKLSSYKTADWYCDNIPETVGINYYIYSEQRWGWHSTRMPVGAFDPILVMTEGYQISTSGPTEFTFIGV